MQKDLKTDLSAFTMEQKLQAFSSEMPDFRVAVQPVRLSNIPEINIRQPFEKKMSNPTDTSYI